MNEQTLYRLVRTAPVLLVIAAFLVIAAQPAFAYQDSPISIEVLTPALLPWDSVPSPDGETVYFTATADGQPAVFSIPAAGGDIVTLAQDTSLVMPLGIAVSTDGQTVYVTDPWTAGANGNAVFAIPSSGGAGSVVSGTQGTAPQGVEVVSQNGTDQLYFTGIDPINGQPTVYTIAASGGTAAIFAKGAPMIAPSGITIAPDGTIYVLDRLASGNGLGGVIRIQGSSIDIIAENVRTGSQLAGLALMLDGTLLVSSLDPTQGTAQVLVIDPAALTTSIINEVIGVNTAAGGLHRAHNVNVFSWIDSEVGSGGGNIYILGRRR